MTSASKPTRQKTQCSKCGSFKVARVIYGMVDFDDRLEKLEEQGRVVLGGCSITGNDPKYECTDCGIGFYKRPTGIDPNWTGAIGVTGDDTLTTISVNRVSYE